MSAAGACTDSAPLDRALAGIAAVGYAIVANALPAPVVAGLRGRASTLHAAHEMMRAGVGRGGRPVRDPGVRGDSIAWLPEQSHDPFERALRDLLEDLRKRCNRDLLLGLFDFEGHYALYPPGAAYARHRDRFRDDDTRVLSFVLYLNEDWRHDQGGALRLYCAEGNALEVTPTAGTVVMFLAADFEHEVLPATRARWSVTGWFRRRPI